MEIEFYPVATRDAVGRNVGIVDFVPTRGGQRWPNRPPGLWNERLPCSRPSVIAAARTSPTVRRDCDLAPSTALRLLRTLETTGFVTKEEVAARTGPEVASSNSAPQALSNESLIDLAKPAMEKLVVRDRGVRLSERRRARATRRSTSASSRARIRSGTPAGSVERFHSTRRRRDTRCAGDVPDDGYVVVERGVEADVTAIACPVYSEARIVAALSLVVPSYRLTASQTVQYGRLAGLSRGGRCPPN